RLLFFEWRDGTFVTSSLPTLAGVTSLALGDVDGDGKNDLVLASPEEDTVAWKSGALPLDEFPVALKTIDKPVAVAVDPAGGVLVLGRNDRRNAQLHRTRPDAEPEPLLDLGRLPADPATLLVADIGDAEGLEVAFVVPNEGLRVVTLGAGKGDDKAAAKSAGTAGFTKKLDDGALAVCSYEGKPALVAVRERFVRTFRIDAAGQVHVLRQDNGPAGLDELSLSAELPGGGRLYLDKKSNKLVRAISGQAPTSVDVPAYDFTQLRLHADAALLIGPRGVLRVPFGDGPMLQQVAVLESPTDKTSFWFGRCGDFDNDGIGDLAIVDGRLPGVHILAGSSAGLARALAIPVFEAGPSEEPDNEPRELATGDLDGDGRCDLVLLAHDRILIYLQQP
ncbi:MAG: FG-GAP repeat protein, partial [Planctomycetes bacterium]|nr:FG-GAP repeat protein [Planctomycetota bacterium]